jgi:hypothetical protein
MSENMFINYHGCVWHVVKFWALENGMPPWRTILTLEYVPLPICILHFVLQLEKMLIVFVVFS